MARDAGGALGLGDRLILLVAWMATCGLVYLLGFYVGKGAQERRAITEQQVLRLPVTSTPPPEGRREKAESEFDFYGKLMGGERAAERADVKKGDEAKPAPEPALARPMPPAPAKPSPPAPAVAAKAAPSPAPTVVARPTPPPPPRPFHVAAEVVPAAKPSPPPVAAPEASRPLGAPAPAPGAGWTVLANPTRSRDEADELTRQLRGRGYDATLVRVLRDGDTWYRVQIGRFASSEQATEMMRRLRGEGVEHAFVASE